MTARRVAVVGAGITGLAAAHHVLTVAERGVEVDVFDPAARVGGKILTEPFAGKPLDCAADAFLARVPEAVTLCHDLGLEDQLVTPAERRAYLYSGGSLRRFPEGLVLGIPTDLDALARSGIVSPAGVERAARDLELDGEPLGPRDDVSVGALVRTRLGDEVFERLVAPLLSGVHAGDADRLSVELGAPQIAAAARAGASLIAGARAQLAAAADPDAPVFYGLRGGTSTLIDALLARMMALGARVHLGAGVERIERDGDDYVLVHGAERSRADAVVLATPDFVTAGLLGAHEPDVAEELREVEYASVAMVAFAVDPGAVGVALDGSGFLVPEDEGLLMTACSWASSKWAHLGSGGPVLLRVSAGRHQDRRASSLEDAELVGRLWADVAATMDVSGDPTAVRVTRWADSLPQFRPGHLSRARRWAERLGDVLPRVELAGAGVAGLGIPACIRQGQGAAERLLS